MQLFITEKPKTARQLCAVLGNSRHIPSSSSTKFGGHKQGDGWMVAWLSGHFYRLLHPKEYNAKYKYWHIADLPIIYSDIDWTPIDESTFPTPDDILEQIAHIQSLYPKVTELILATDGDQEGQVLGQVFLEQSGWTGPVKRLWTGVWEPSGLTQKLSSLQDNAAYQGVYHAGISRLLLDKLIGINLTILYTLKAQQAGYNLVANSGRVRSPATTIAVDHEAYVKSHTARQYHSLRANLSYCGQPFRAKFLIPGNLLTDTKHCFDEAAIASVHNSIMNEKHGVITNVISKTTNQKPPAPFSQNTLSQYCNQEFGLLPHETLDEAQKLYEAGYLSYPRTESELYEMDVLENVDKTFGVLRTLNDTFKVAIEQASIKNPQPVFSFKDIVGHCAIFVTSLKPDLNQLSNIQKSIYTVVANRFIAQFMPDQVTAHYKLIIKIGDYTFEAESQSVVSPGWTLVEPKKSDQTSELPVIDIGTSCDVEEVLFHKRMTKAPPRLTVDVFQEILKDCTHLLSPNIAKRVGTGMLGTGATQPHILKTITEQGVVQIVDKKYVVPTKRGRDLRNLWPDLISSPDLTALWDLNFKAIHAGQLSHIDFINKALAWLTDIVNNGKKTKFPPSPTMTPCEICGSALLRRESPKNKNNHYWICSNSECKATFQDVAGLPLTLHQKHGSNCDDCDGKMLTRYEKKSKKTFLKCSKCHCVRD